MNAFKYFVSPGPEFEYLGAFSGAVPPKGSIEVPAPRPSPAHHWDGKAWVLVFTLAATSELTAFRTVRAAVLSRISELGFVALATGDTETRDALVAFRQGVLDLPAHPSVTAANTLPALKTALKNQYGKLTDGLPTSIRGMFKDMTST